MGWRRGVGGDVACGIAQEWRRWRRIRIERHGGDWRGFQRDRARERNGAEEARRVYKCGGVESREGSREGGCTDGGGGGWVGVGEQKLIECGWVGSVLGGLATVNEWNE
jgi:hypothetical protein